MTSLRERSATAQGLSPLLTDLRFWVVQLLTVLITAAITILWTRWLAGQPYGWAVPIIDVANLLYLIPVLFAALNFGLAGGVATAVFVAIFRGAFLLVWHDPLQEWILGAVYVTVLSVAVVVGQRVEQERGARREAEAARNAARASEALFRRLFEQSPAPTMLLDLDTTIKRANPAAAAFFGRPNAELVGASLAGVVGFEMAAAIASGEQRAVELAAPQSQQRFARPVVGRLSDAGEETLLVVLVDVSEERRQLGVADAYAEAMLHAQEEERARIAQELHDEPLQQVVQLCHQLDRAAGLDTSAPDALAAARRTAEGIADELRRLAAGLRPLALDELGLSAALRIVTRTAQERAPRLMIGVEIRGRERRLDPLVELNLFRIAQEALRNAERHADASKVALTLTFGRSDVNLCVADNGRGLEQDGNYKPEAGRLGLVGMRERAKLLGAQLDVSAQPGAGTRIEVSIQTA
jgi:PAS domain S-box-containing protein